MPLLYVRAIAPYTPGYDATDVIVNEIHFNRTALDHYNYTLYTNGTLSNGTDCYLAFQHFRPYMFANNGSFVNGTSCYAPIHDIGRHAGVGMAFALLFAISIIFNLAGLRKHGRRYLPPPTDDFERRLRLNLNLPMDKRWTPVGRRWKWYWLLALSVVGAVGAFMSIDVDRSHVQSTALLIQSVFYTLLTPIMLAAVWESVRHWATWKRRQVTACDPYAFTQKSTRETQELYLPVIFYVFAFINFFLAVPRNWDSVERQRSPSQTLIQAKPFATDSRFKAAGFMALVAVFVICYSLEHSVYRYIPKPISRGRGMGTQAMFYIHSAPSHFLVAIILLLIKSSYDIASAWNWDISPLRYGVHPGWIYGLGFTPALLLLILFNIIGLCEVNEDKALIAQRVELEDALASDTPLGMRKSRVDKWIGRLHLPTHKRREKEVYDRAVEMETIKKDDKDKDRDGNVRVTTAPPARTDSQSSVTETGTGTGNPFLDDSSAKGDFVDEVLAEIEERQRS